MLTTNNRVDLLTFLALKVLYKDTDTPADLSPSALVDLVWHTHMNNPSHYLDSCHKLGVGIIDHDPEAANDQDGVRYIANTGRSFFKIGNPF